MKTLPLLLLTLAGCASTDTTVDPVAESGPIRMELGQVVVLRGGSRSNEALIERHYCPGGSLSWDITTGIQIGRCRR